MILIDGGGYRLDLRAFGGGARCVEVADLADGVLVRDTKDRDPAQELVERGT